MRKFPSDLGSHEEWATLTVKKRNLLAIGIMRRIQNVCYSLVLEVDTGSLDLISAYGTCVRASYGFSPSKELLASDCHRDSVDRCFTYCSIAVKNSYKGKHSTGDLFSILESYPMNIIVRSR